VAGTVKLTHPGATSSKYFPIDPSLSRQFPTLAWLSRAWPSSRRSYYGTQSGIPSQGTPLVTTKCAELQGRCTPVPWITLDTAVLYRDAPRSPCSKPYPEFHRISGHGSSSPGVCVLDKEIIQVTKRRFGKKTFLSFPPSPVRSLPVSLDSEAAADRLPNDRCASAQLHASREGY
jgi:hypothetical protein